MHSKITSITTPESGTITAFAEGQSFTIGRDHPNYEQIKQAITQGDVFALKRLADIPQGVTTFSEGKVQVKDGEVFYDDQPLHNILTERILGLMRDGFDFQPMLRFLENLMDNPSRRATTELFKFLTHQNLPLTDDGCFLAYKRVRDDWFDVWTGKINNVIGATVQVERNQVDDDCRHPCSHGLHVGTIEYVRGYTGNGCVNGGHVVIVKVNPRDAVSVPLDEKETKLRVCRYEVIGEYSGDLTGPLYSGAGAALSAKPRQSPWSREEEDYNQSAVADPTL
jgi:hypothetical protein